MSARIYTLKPEARSLEKLEIDIPDIDERDVKVQQLALSLSYLEMEARRAGFDFVAKLIQAACVATQDEIKEKEQA